MEQKEYDEQMNSLNLQMNKEIELLKERLDSITKKRFQLKEQILKLKTEEIMLGNDYYEICSKIKRIKQKYISMKHDLYLNRPQINEAPGNNE